MRFSSMKKKSHFVVDSRELSSYPLVNRLYRGVRSAECQHRKERIMKKISVFVAVAAVALTGAVALAQTNVYSRNAVGAIRLDLDKGKLYMISHQLFPLGTNVTTPELVLGTTNSLPVGTRLYLWNPLEGGGAYFTELLRSNGKWNPGTNELRGKAFWISVPDTAVSNSYTVFMMGEVPDTTTMPTSVVAVVGGGEASQFNMLTFQYPVATAWTGTTLATSASVGDRIYIWDAIGGPTSNGAYVSSLKRSNGTWNNNSIVLQPGQGFWFSTTNTSLWSESKPYVWP